MSRQSRNNRNKKRRKLRKDRLIILGTGVLALFLILFFGIKSVIGLFGSDNKNATTQNKTTTTEKKDKDKDTAPKEKKQTFKVMIDAGHGGKDEGSAGGSDIKEKDVNLAVAKLVGSKLSKYNDVEVIMTRNEDNFVKIPDRINMANSMKADIYISIHANAQIGKSDAYGIETYHKTNADEASKNLAKTIQSTLLLYVDAKDRGVIPRDYDVIKFTKTPAALVELGFISNKEEGEKLTNKTYQDHLAEGVTQGILAYLDKLKAQH